MLARVVRSVSVAAPRARFNHPAPAGAAPGKRYDLFGYEVSADCKKYVEEIKKCHYYDDAGEVIVKMNLNNTPPDLETYNALLERILSTPSKRSTPVEGEDKLAAMMDILEEMDHRSGIKPNAESWLYVLKHIVEAKNFRLGWLCIAAMKRAGYDVPNDLAQANEASYNAAKSTNTEFPVLEKFSDVFDVKPKVVM